MRKSELKQLIKVIVQEAVAARQQKLEESKGLSGFKKTADSVEHTEKIATEKNLTANSEPKEKEEGKKLPVVKKPATPSVMKEDVVAMIREELEKHRTDEMARTPASIRDGVAYGIGNKFKVQDMTSPTGWSIKDHPNSKLYPDGMPTEAPKGPYVPKGENPNVGRPEKDVSSMDVGSDDEDGEDDADDEVAKIAQKMGYRVKSAKPNSEVIVKLNGKKIGKFDFRLPSGRINSNEIDLYTIGDSELANYNLTPSVDEKYQALQNLFFDDKLPQGATLELVVDKSRSGEDVIAK